MINARLRSKENNLGLSLFKNFLLVHELAPLYFIPYFLPKNYLHKLLKAGAVAVEIQMMPMQMSTIFLPLYLKII